MENEKSSKVRKVVATGLLLLIFLSIVLSWLAYSRHQDRRYWSFEGLVFTEPSVQVWKLQEEPVWVLDRCLFPQEQVTVVLYPQGGFVTTLVLYRLEGDRCLEQSHPPKNGEERWFLITTVRPPEPPPPPPTLSIP